MKVLEKANEIYLEYKSELFLLISANGQIELKKIYELIQKKELNSNYIKDNLLFDETINSNITEGLRLFLQDIFKVNDGINETGL